MIQASNGPGSAGRVAGHSGPMFTIFIPSYNRAYCLPRALQSVAESTCQDLEVVLIDDGSTDDTRAVVADWQGRAPFPLRYFFQDNAGKANAHNRAVAEAQGYFFINLDSDDSLIPEALDAVLAEWATVPEGQREGLSGIAGLLLEEDGSVSGTTLPAGPGGLGLPGDPFPGLCPRRQAGGDPHQRPARVPLSLLSR